VKSHRVNAIQNVEEPERFEQEAITVKCRPVIEVWTNRVVGYHPSIRHSRDAWNPLACDNGHYARGKDDGRDLFYLNLLLQKAREMGFKRVFLKIESSLLRAMATISTSPEMEVVVELTDLRQIGDLHVCQEMISTWRAQGIQFAMNDFGIGFIGLPLIARLRPDYIMIDFSGMVKAVAFEELQPITRELFPVLKSFAGKALVYIP